MEKAPFIAYIGPPEMHDARILRWERDENRVIVLVCDYDKSLWELEFLNVSEVIAHNAEGMILYALVEMSAVAPARCFVFQNWHEADESDAVLEIVAEQFDDMKISRAA